MTNAFDMAVEDVRTRARAELVQSAVANGDDRGHDAEDMRKVLRLALRMLDGGGVPMAQLRVYADYLEAMAFANATRWFRPPSRLSWAWREYFELADRLEERFRAAAGERVPDDARRILVSAMTVLTSRVLSFVAHDSKHASEATSLPLLLTATKASNRVRRWCSTDEPGIAQMLGVLSYSVVSVASRAVGEIARSGDPLAPMVDATSDALDEVLDTLKQLATEHSPQACFDHGLGAHLGGEPSRAVRALQGVAWSHDVLGQVGFVPDEAQLKSLLDLLESLWHEAHGRPNETRGLVATAAHLTSAWSSLLEAGGSDSLQPAVRSLWIARQASCSVEHDLAIAHGLLEVAQAVVAVSGVALRRELDRSLGLAVRAAELCANVVGRCHGAISPPILMGVLDNLMRIASESCERHSPEFPRLLEQLTLITSAALPRS
jgi:hypothetical protein